MDGDCYEVGDRVRVLEPASPGGAAGTVVAVDGGLHIVRLDAHPGSVSYYGAEALEPVHPPFGFNRSGECTTTDVLVTGGGGASVSVIGLGG